MGAGGISRGARGRIAGLLERTDGGEGVEVPLAPEDRREPLLRMVTRKEKDSG